MKKLLIKKKLINYSILLSFVSQIFILNTFKVSASTFQSICDELTMIEFEREYPGPRFSSLRKHRKKDNRPECSMQISLNSEEIINKYVTIPTTRVTSWSVNGESTTDTGGKVVATLAFGVIGFLAANPQKHDYILLINGYDIEGKKTMIKMKFKDGKQPPRLITELSIFTGLGMGQKRSLEEIKKIEKEGKFNTLNESNNSKELEFLY